MKLKLLDTNCMEIKDIQCIFIALVKIQTCTSKVVQVNNRCFIFNYIDVVWMDPLQ